MIITTSDLAVSRLKIVHKCVKLVMISANYYNIA